MNLDSLSFSDLRIFLTIHRLGSATRCSCVLSVSNSAISRTLNHLREMFGDPLFIRTNLGLEPTKTADSLAPIFSELLQTYRKIDKTHVLFNPATSEGAFEILAYDEFNYPVSCVIREEILKEAPHMQFVVKTLNYDCVPDLLKGQVDFAVVYEGFCDSRLQSECFSQTEDIYLLMRKGHPLSIEGLSFDINDISHFSVLEIDNFNDLTSPLLVDVCHEFGREMSVASYTESVATAFRTLMHSDAVTVVCNQFTLEFADAVPGLTYVKLPQPVMDAIKQKRSKVKPIGNYLVYGSSSNSAAFEWVRDKLVKGLGAAWSRALNRNKSAI